MSNRAPRGGRQGARRRRPQGRRGSQGALRQFLHRLGSIAAFGLALFFLYSLLYSPVFTVRKVVVQQNEVLDVDTVAETADVFGRNVFRLNSDEVREKLAALPQVQSVEVLPRLPDVVVLRVHERQAAYNLVKDGRAYLLAADGTVLTEGEEAPGVPTILDKGAREVQPGERFGQELLKATERLKQWLPDKTGLSVQQFEYSPGEGLSLTSDNGYRIIFGSGENLGSKLATLQSILEQLPSDSHIQYIDLRSEGRPVVR